jgi:glycosyltransferase involved in cell wall biosynthesis
MRDRTVLTERPLISVILEGYNESKLLGVAEETMTALNRQNFPLDQVEVVLVGSSAQTNEWKQRYSVGTPFSSVKMVALDGAHYYQLKNAGAEMASGEIIAFTDSDVHPRPGWLSAIAAGINNGADVVVGPCLFRLDNGPGPDAALMQAAASISFGWVAGKSGDKQLPSVRGFLAHNVAFRADTFRRYRFRTDLGRTLAPPLLYRALTDAGAKIAFQPEQQVSHYFAWGWWLSKLHFRWGYEVFMLRRLDKAYPNQWIARTKGLEPLVTMLWHVLLDIPRWFRFSRLLRLGSMRRFALLPVVIVISIAARGFELIGMYSTLLAPKAMKRWAETA